MTQGSGTQKVKSYTRPFQFSFNGLGEYTMVKLLDDSDNDACTVQVRTQQWVKEDNSTVDATVFGAVLLTCPPSGKGNPRTSIEVKLNGKSTGKSQ